MKKFSIQFIISFFTLSMVSLFVIKIILPEDNDIIGTIKVILIYILPVSVALNIHFLFSRK
jgi:hypothetical protein